MTDSDSDNDNFYFSLSSNSDELISDDSFHSISSLRDNLISAFSDKAKNFNVVHLNAQSIPAHFPDMLANFDVDGIHAILISETWLKSCHPSVSYSLPGFRLIRHDRVARGGGGVAIYLRSHIPFNIISTSDEQCQPTEHLFVEVTLSHTKILLGVFYSPSLLINYFSSLEDMLENLSPIYNHIMILGDFNTCLLKNDARSMRLKDIINSSNLTLLPLTATHFFPNCTPSLLDLMFVSSPNHVVSHGQITADAFSYHDLLYLSYRIRTPKNKPKILMQRNFRAIDTTRLLDDARNINWSVVEEADDVNTQIKLFNNLLLKLYDKHAPTRPVKVKHLPAPWLTDDLKTLMNKRNRAKCKFKSNPSDENKTKYNMLRNRCNTACRDAQRRHIHKSVENGNPAMIWKFLRSLGVGKTSRDFPSTDLDLNSINIHFSSCTSIDDVTKTSSINYLSSLPTPKHTAFNFTQFSDCDVKKSIISISSNAVGADSISRNMILPLLDFLTPLITNILNNSISNCSFPVEWKRAHIIPLPKKLNPISFADYRPISILPFLSKVLERLVHRQLSCFLTTNNLLNPVQSGFRPGHSTTTALVKISDDIRLGMENRQATILTLLDFSNAFNSVDHDILLSRLGSLNISPTAIEWLRSYLRGRQQCVRVNDMSSTWRDITAGVPQGGVLSPLLFSVFINSITSNLSSTCHLYADDLQIYTQCSLDNLSNGIAIVNTDLGRIVEWSKFYGLSVNPGKTQAIIIGGSKLIAKINWHGIPSIFFDGVSIPFKERVRNLGIIFDRSLSWVPQVGEVSRKMFASVKCLNRLRNFLPISTKVALAQSLLLPILDYADTSYLDLTVSQLNKLERLQNLCIRFIFGLRKYDHVSPFRAQLEWLPIHLRRNSHILFLLFSVLFNPNTPSYLKERFCFLSETHSRSLRSSQSLLLHSSSHTSHYYHSSFTIKAVELWNSLPLSVKQAQTLNSFKLKVKAHFLGSLS